MIFVTSVSDKLTTPETYDKTIEYLDAKKVTVMELTAASTAASIAVSAIPGDAATPVANKLADLSGSFMIVLAAIYLEKYLLTITGYAACYFLVPAACILFSVNVFLKNATVREFMVKLITLAIMICLIVPVSVKVSSIIEDTYEMSFEQTISAAKEATAVIEDNSEDKGLWDRVVTVFKEGATTVKVTMETLISNFIESLAVMIVTSCIIPILVMLLFAWVIKSVMGINITVPKKLNLPKASNLLNKEE